MSKEEVSPVVRAREYAAGLRRRGEAVVARFDGPKGADSDASELFADASFRAHFEDAQARSSLLRSLVKARNSAGMTQKAVAETMETTQSAVCELEGGSIDPRLSTLQRYARSVGCHLQIRLNLYASIVAEPALWPALEHIGSVPNLGNWSVVSVLQSSVPEGIDLTNYVDLTNNDPEPVPS
jgi:DNA-binding XRE family transcriptional regulator